mmetsp:Transcript_24354/g.36541  ORF Transcript_24354/g.36541 Transcript_24354/m.36541 type:complete len:277 (+) Transcript_24354:55-885(+)
MGCGGSRKPSNVSISISPTKEGVGTAAAKYIAEIAAESIKEKGKFVVAFSGGSLPKIVGGPLSEMKALETDKWTIVFSDERCVKLDSEDSNYKSVMEHVATPLDIKNVVSINEELVDDSVAMAQDYQAKLIKAVGDAKGEIPEIDLVLLGMGGDGHTCSLFPGHKLLKETTLLIASLDDSPKPPPSRITFTYPLLDKAAVIAFVCTGAAKSGALARVFGNKDKGKNVLPSARVSGKVRWFVDKAAAAELEKPEKKGKKGETKGEKKEAEDEKKAKL